MFKARSYQIQAVEAVMNCLTKGDKKVMCRLPTGAGKTVIATLIIEKMMEIHPSGKVLFIAHRKEILDQTFHKISSHLGLDSVGIEQAERLAGDKKIIVASIQSLSQRIQNFDPSEFSLVIVDECHHIYAKTWIETVSYFMGNNRTFIVGLTATPTRSDGMNVESYFDTVAFEIGLSCLQDLGYLVRVDYHTISANIGLGSIMLNSDGDFQNSSLSAVMNSNELRELAIRAWKEKGVGCKTIVFCASVSHAENMKNDFIREGVIAEVVTGKSKDRDMILQDFRSGGIQVLTNYGVLTEGFDDPTIQCVLLARPTTSPLVYNQCLGRGLRSTDGKEKCIVIDLVDRCSHALQYTAYQAAGLPKEWKSNGRDPLRESRAIASIRISNPEAFLRIKRALSMEDIQHILVSLPPNDVISGLDGKPVVRYETCKRRINSSDAYMKMMEILINIDALKHIKSLSVYDDFLSVEYIDTEPAFMIDFYSKHATGRKVVSKVVCNDAIIVSDEENKYSIEHNPRRKIRRHIKNGFVSSIKMDVTKVNNCFHASGEIKLQCGYMKSRVHKAFTKKDCALDSLATEMLNFAEEHADIIKKRFYISSISSVSFLEESESPLESNKKEEYDKKHDSIQERIRKLREELYIGGIA